MIKVINLVLVLPLFFVGCTTSSQPYEPVLYQPESSNTVPKVIDDPTNHPIKAIR